MRAEIISIGSELTSGQNLDTNARWLSRRLAEVGITSAFHVTVGDDLDDNFDVFAQAMTRSELVLATGGLGPTLDDMTREALAMLLGVKLVLDEPSLRRIEEMFRKRGRTMAERNRVQALFPQGAVVIPNHHGTAPGIWIEHRDCAIVCMPGVPAEMVAMFDDWVLPRLQQHCGSGEAIVGKTIRCYGAGESDIELRLGDLTRRGRNPEVGITASEATISLRITAKADSPQQARQLIQPDADAIYRALGELIYGEDDDTLQDVVARLLAQTGRTIATAESCTGGLVGHLLTEVAGISEFYLGGVVTYSNDAKRSLLDVGDDLLSTHGAVSEEVATAMAVGCRSRFGSELAVAVTGIAGPGGGSEAKPVGLVYVALAHEGGVETGKYNWAAGRSSVKLRSAKTALNLVRRHLLREVENHIS